MERRDTHASELTVRIRTGALLTLILLGAFQARQVPGILEGLSTLLGLLGCFELLRAMGLLDRFDSALFVLPYTVVFLWYLPLL